MVSGTSPEGSPEAPEASPYLLTGQLAATQAVLGAQMRAGIPVGSAGGRTNCWSSSDFAEVVREWLAELSDRSAG